MNRVTDVLKASDPDIFLRAAIRSAVKSGHRIVFDSVRYERDWDYLSTRGFLLCRVEAPLDLRVARLKTRGQAFEPISDGQHPSEAIGETLPASVVFDNVDDLLHLTKQAEMMVTRHTH